MVIRYNWTLEEFLRGYHYYYRFACRPLFRFCFHFIFGMMMVGGVWGIYNAVRDDRSSLAICWVFTFVGVCWFAIRPFWHCWSLRRKFARHPDKDVEIEWQVADDRLSRWAQGHLVFSWEMFRMAVRAPVGLLLYFPNGSFYWLPRHGFTSDAEFERFITFLKGKLHGFYNVV